MTEEEASQKDWDMDFASVPETTQVFHLCGVDEEDH
jgi:hypothetical protein